MYLARPASTCVRLHPWTERHQANHLVSNIVRQPEPAGLWPRDFVHSDLNPYRGSTGSSFDLAFSHNYCLHDVAWIHPSYMWTTRVDVGTASPIVLARQKPLPKQSKNKFASLQHRPLIIAQTWNGCSCPPQGSGRREWAIGLQTGVNH